MVWDKICAHTFNAKQYQLLFHECQSISWEICLSWCFLPELCEGVSQCGLGWVSDTACNKYMPRSLVHLQTPTCPCPCTKWKNLEQVLSLFTWTLFLILFHLKLSSSRVKAVSLVRLNSEIKHGDCFHAMLLFCMIFKLLSDYARI